MARPRLDPEGAEQVTLRLPVAQVAEVTHRALASGRPASVVWREVIAAGLANPTTKSEPGLFIPQALLEVQGEGEVGGGVAAAANFSGAAPSRPERPSPVPLVELTSPQAGGSAAQSQPPAQGAPPAAKAKPGHVHKVAKIQGPLEFCSCGAFKAGGGPWNEGETRTGKSYAETAAPIEEPPDEEW